ncbi:hypothetical protein LP419_19365 [Massilia sp. H-1]|nr:hypothetical protein LP419_19365 [Massilia sp. H-1]
MLLAHGLCMNDLQWHRDGHDHGAMLARERGYTPVYLHYNSGRHISENGRELVRELQAMIDNWPVAVDELLIVAHSMGAWSRAAPATRRRRKGTAGPGFSARWRFSAHRITAPRSSAGETGCIW